MTHSAMEKLLGPHGSEIAAAMHAGLRFVDRLPLSDLLRHAGRQVEEVPPFHPVDKKALQDSYGGKETGTPDDFLVGRGLFYLSEQRRLFLDCTSGHYQMLWGFNHPELCALIIEAMAGGVVWDNHSNIPQTPVKQLAHKLVEVGNAPGERDRLDTVLLGVCTGSVACGAALKIMLKVHAQKHGPDVKPVLVALGGNYHGTDIVPQFMRGMWEKLVLNIDSVMLEPNQPEQIEAVFHKHGSRIAGFWAEPVMMNREALLVDPAYLRLARRLCDQAGALMCIDEIQTGFWQPHVFAYRELGLQPDLVVVGKGMTAGFHPLSGVLMKSRYDVLEQYDAISTNGSASLPSLIALRSLQMIHERASRIRSIGQRITDGFSALAAEFPDRLQSVQGSGYLSGLKFRQVVDALEFHKQLLQAGIWARVHAYHAGHSTVLTKLGLLADETIVDFMLERFRSILRGYTKAA